MNTSTTVEISKDIYWVGGSCLEGGLHCNPYIIIDNDDVILIDPGSVIDFEYVYQNICSLVPLEKIKYVILHHQDPDFCSSVTLFENKGANFTIITHWRTQVLVKYYGIKSEYYIVNENDYQLILKSGRVIKFIPTPYLHFAGSIATYDVKSKILFSSDLFGAFSEEWSLYAGSDYIEKMKTFHEHYMPSNDILRPIMEVFLRMDISMIAPQHGSIIKNDVKKYIKVLRELECGSFMTPIKKELVSSDGYKVIIGSVLKRYASIYNNTQVFKCIKGLDIAVDDNLNVTSLSQSGYILLDLLFEKILSTNGLDWLIVIEPLMQKLSKEYDIPLPKIYNTTLKKITEQTHNLNQENEMLKSINQKLRDNIAQSKDMLIKDEVTGIYNFDFFNNYLLNEIKRITEENSKQNPGLIIISLDNIGRVIHAYGEAIVNEILKYTVYILEDIIGENDILFRLEGTHIGCNIPHTTKDDITQFAEKIRNEIASSKKFLDKITASIGVATFDEIYNRSEYAKNQSVALYNVAMMRVRLAESMGKNIVCNDSKVGSYQTELAQILLVDTDQINIDVLKTFLENSNFKVITANDGEEAIRIVENNVINLIVSEIMLPKIDGFLVREKLLSQSFSNKIPFIIISHLKDEDSVLRASRLGIENYFQKPFMISEFLGVVKNKIKGD